MSLDVRLSILLRQLRLPTVATNYRKFAQEAAQSGQPYEEYLLALVEHEANQREVNRRKRRIQEAHFPLLRTLDEFDFRATPGVNPTQVLELARGEYLEQRENVALIGGIGTGKPRPTHYPYRLNVLSRPDGDRRGPASPAVRAHSASGGHHPEALPRPVLCGVDPSPRRASRPRLRYRS
jgi:hypothetical protein